MEIVLQGGQRDSSAAMTEPTTRALGGQRPLLRVGKRTAGACVASSPDSDLEARSVIIQSTRPSRLFDARGRPPKEPFPVRPPPPARRRARRRAEQLEQSADSRRGFGTGTPGPALAANPFPEVTDPFCRLPLPTLFHRPRRSPWRPDAVMSTTGVDGTRSSGFSRAAGSAPTPRDVRCSSSRRTLPPAEPPSSGGQAVKQKKITLPEAPADVSDFQRRRQPPRPGSGILTRFPFEYARNALSAGIRTDGRSARLTPKVLQRPPRPPTSSGPRHLPRRPGVGRALKRHPFSGLVDSAVTDFDFHDHRPARLNRPTPFVGSRLARSLAHRNPASGFIPRRAPLTKNGPLGALDSVARLNKAAAPTRTRAPAYPKGNFGGNQLLDGSISLSPLYPSRRTICTSASLRASTEFPPASPPPRIVHHHLRVPTVCSHSNPSRRSRSVGGAPLGGSHQSAFLTPYGFTRPLTRTHVDSFGPCFKTGRMGSPQPRPSAQMPKHAAGRALPATIGETAFRGRIESPGFGRPPNPRWSTPRVDRRTGSSPFHIRPGASPAPIRFPPDNFKHSLTLFSKSFSSFPRGTCSLSVSRPYLALDGIHRPIWAAFPNNPTRRQRLVVRQGPGTTGLSPSPAPPSRGLGPGPPPRTLLRTTHGRRSRPILRLGCSRFARLPPDLGSRSERCEQRKEGPESERATATPRHKTRVGSQPPHAATSVDVDPHLGRPRARGAREASIRPRHRRVPHGGRGVRGRRDA
ncbi:hypothetical protein RND71_034627 [Anisodus tanguticus]|uniref:Protein TAR1 n=1 Tax=Anisodus tanguticus TaxID=243964 RepID=A0AAE1RBS1_9SOLA|nr:hypothetical protein RND71_034627 [Anisodus tanguticus]